MSKTAFITVRLTEAHLRTIDRLRRQCESPPSRPELIRQLIDKAGAEGNEATK